MTIFFNLKLLKKEKFSMGQFYNFIKINTGIVRFNVMDLPNDIDDRSIYSNKDH